MCYVALLNTHGNYLPFIFMCYVALLNTHGLVPFKLPWQTTKQIHGTPPRVIPLVDAHATLGYPQLRRASHNTAGLTAAAQGYPKRRRDTHNIKRATHKAARAPGPQHGNPQHNSSSRPHTSPWNISNNRHFYVLYIVRISLCMFIYDQQILYIDWSSLRGGGSVEVYCTYQCFCLKWQHQNMSHIQATWAMVTLLCVRLTL